MTDDNDDIGPLLRAAGRRAAPPPEAMARIRGHVHDEWRQALALRARRRVFAVAAAVLVVVGAGVLFIALREQPMSVPASTTITARVTRGSELLSVERRGLAVGGDADPELLSVGDRISTGASSGALLAQLPHGTTTLRLDRNTTLQWLAHDRLQLLSGRLYVDTGRVPDTTRVAGVTDALVIEAARVSVRHVGTQFVATLVGDTVTVGVRDGRVQVRNGTDSAELARGERATMSGALPLQRGRMPTTGEGWRWADELAPRIPIEGRNLAAVVRALAYQAGLQLTFASARAEADAVATTLHGPALDMTPDAALQAILATTSFRSARSGQNGVDSIVIDAR